MYFFLIEDTILLLFTFLSQDSGQVQGGGEGHDHTFYLDK